VQTKGKGIFIVAFLMLGIFIILAPPLVFGQAGGLPMIRLTGVVYPADAKDIRGGLKNLMLIAEKKEWLLKLTKAENVYNTDVASLQVSESLSDRLNLQEAKKWVLAPFQKPDMVGKTITIQGLVDSSSDLMEVYQLTVGEVGK